MKERCRETLEQAYAYLDGELDEVKTAEIESHLQDCAPCYERVGLDREIKHIIARLRGADPCPSQLRARIRSLLD